MIIRHWHKEFCWSKKCKRFAPISEQEPSEPMARAASITSASVDFQPPAEVASPAAKEPSAEEAEQSAEGTAPSPAEEVEQKLWKQRFGQWATRTIKSLCLIRDDFSVRLVTRNVLRETVKQRADIHESSGRGASLNMHAMLLLLVTAVLWGFLA